DRIDTRVIMDPREIASQVLPSTVMITMKDKNNQPYSLGSGFVVASGMVITNHHVIQNAASGSVRLNDQDQDYIINGFFSIDPLHDLVLLDTPGIDAPSIKISD